MDYPKVIVTNQKEESIYSIQRVEGNEKMHLTILARSFTACILKKVWIKIKGSEILGCLIGSYMCHLLISFANSLDPDQVQQNVGPDLGPSCLTLGWYS